MEDWKSGHYFEIDNNESLVFRDYLENLNRKVNVEFREEVTILRPPTPVSMAVEEIGVATSDALSLGLTPPVSSDSAGSTIDYSSETGEPVEIFEREIETLPSRMQTLVIKRLLVKILILFFHPCRNNLKTTSITL